MSVGLDISLYCLIVLLNINKCICGKCTRNQQYLQQGESLVSLTIRCGCIDDLNDSDKVYNFAISQLCSLNWATIISQTYEPTCINQSFGTKTKYCCDFITMSELLQLPDSCFESFPAGANDVIKSNVHDCSHYGLLVQFLIAVTGCIVVYLVFLHIRGTPFTRKEQSVKSSISMITAVPIADEKSPGVEERDVRIANEKSSTD